MERFATEALDAGYTQVHFASNVKHQAGLADPCIPVQHDLAAWLPQSILEPLLKPPFVPPGEHLTADRRAGGEDALWGRFLLLIGGHRPCSFPLGPGGWGLFAGAEGGG